MAKFTFNWKQTASFVLKLCITSAALYFVFQKIDFELFKQTLSTVNLGFFALAFLFFNVSKIISAYRLLVMYKLAGVELDGKANLKFYYLGMFYNMFLPGSIGGDAFKVYLLKQQQKEASTKKLISAALLDRISGVSFLFVMGGVFLLLSTFYLEIPNYKWYILAATLLVIPSYYVFVKWVFPTFISGFMVTGYYSFFVQLGQVVCAWFILMSLHIDTSYWDYLTLFMASSVFAIIPITIGGAGARELVFIFGANYLHINQPAAVAFAILFFCASALSSLIGLFFIVGIEKQLTTS
ncbi:MAG: flippase-like domain-containing protein [Bacteroidia bacterium]|jgi:hypothetical protein|nr:flippase-like domain-containing protein [Bacteroidia bacterium]